MGGRDLLRLGNWLLLKGGKDLESNRAVKARYVDEQQDTDATPMDG